MTRRSLGRRVGRLGAHARTGCAECQAVPPIVVLWPEDPKPARSCPGCGRPTTGTTWVRFAELDQGPA